MAERGLESFLIGVPVMHDIKGAISCIIKYVLSIKKAVDLEGFYSNLMTKMARKGFDLIRSINFNQLFRFN